MSRKAKHFCARLPFKRTFILGALVILVGVSLTFLNSRTKAATTWHVSVGNPGACTTGDPNCSSIKAAVNAASSGDTIIVAAGTYNEHDIEIDFSLTINGAGANTTIVDAQQLGRVFYTCCGTINISGLTIKNGKSGDGVSGFTEGGGSHGDDGGGIGNQAILTITSCTITNNATGRGGNLLNPNSPVTSKAPTPLVITSSGGRGGNGGGIWNKLPGNLTIRDSTVSNNQTGNGGAANLNGPAGTGGDGGGIWNDATLTVINSTIANNQTGMGGAGFNNNLSPEVSQATKTAMKRPVADVGAGVGGDGGEGGGIANATGGHITIRNSTIASNQTGAGGSGGPVTTPTSAQAEVNGGVGGDGGGVYTGDSNVTTAAFQSTIVANNSVAAGGSGPDVFSDTAVNDMGFNLIGKTDGSTGFTSPFTQKGTIASPLDPKLDPLGLQSNGGPTKTIALQSNSPAIDQGFNESCATTPSKSLSANRPCGLGLPFDQRGPGFPRTIDNPSVLNGSSDATDVGAFELPAPVVTGPCAPDVTPPTITCPSSMNKFTDAGQFSATVNPGSPVAADNCQLKSVTGVRSDGKALNAPYPLGTTIITWTARDAANNAASCSQTIVVSIPSNTRRPLPNAPPE